jgi:mannosyltransferase OCH1-like enzyme
MSSSIPKIIFQTWKTKDIPEKWKESQLSIKEHLPDWQIVLFSDEENREFVKQHFPDFLNIYDSFPYPIQRADMIRYMFLYVNGGLYLDLDMKLKKSIESLIGNEEFYLSPSSNVSSSYTNSIMISKPKSKFWLMVLDEIKKTQMNKNYYFTKHFIVMNTTGPMLLTRTLKKWDKSFGTLPVKKILPCNVCDPNCNENDVYIQQLEGQSWCSVDTKFYNFFICRWKLLIMLFIILLCVGFILYDIRNL